MIVLAVENIKKNTKAFSFIVVIFFSEKNEMIDNYILNGRIEYVKMKSF